MTDPDRPQFNLVDEPFIPSVALDGEAVEHGLRDVLVRAHDLRELRDDSPLVTIALQRLFIAVLHAVLGDPETLDDWGEMWQAGRFDEAAIDDYFEKWRGRFDLFDPERPFYQDPDLDESEPDRSAANRLITGTDPTDTLFEHSTNPKKERDRWEPISAAEAARRLIAIQVCAISGGRGYYKMPFAEGVVVMPQGENLFETLTLNTLPAEERDEFLQPAGTAVWQQDNSPFDRKGLPRGYQQFLTWLPRRVRLYPQVNGSVQTISIAAGPQLMLPEHCFEPWLAYVERSKGPMPLGFGDDRAVWRDSEAILRFSGQDDEKGRIPSILRFVRDLEMEGMLDRPVIGLVAAGQRASNAKVFFTRYERLPLPLAYLIDSDLVARISLGIEAAEDVAYSLKRATKDAVTELLDPTNHRPDPTRRRQVVDSLAAEPIYWSQLETPFRRFFIELAEIPEDNAEARQWRLAKWAIENCQRSAEIAFEESVGRLDQSARMLRARQVGRDSLGRRIGKFLKDKHYWEAYRGDNDNEG